MAPPSVLHVVVTRNFAGAERYVASVASGSAAAGWRSAVIGGDPERMPGEVSPGVTWFPGGTPTQAARSVARAGRFDVCHVHMTLAEAVGAATRRIHRGRLVATRHFASKRGSTRAGRLMAPWIDRTMDCQIAISQFVDQQLEARADAVILNGVPRSAPLWSPASRRVLVLQRLEPEKNTATALHAWKGSGLSELGWVLRVVGAGSELSGLTALAGRLGLRAVDFAGPTKDVESEFRQAGILFAPAAAEPLGLSVIEAMAAGVPVVAAAGGGHAETIGAIPGAPLFPPGEAVEARRLLATVAGDDQWRARLSSATREHQVKHLSLDGHLTSLFKVYTSVAPRPVVVPPQGDQ